MAILQLWGAGLTMAHIISVQFGTAQAAVQHPAQLVREADWLV